MRIVYLIFLFSGLLDSVVLQGLTLFNLAPETLQVHLSLNELTDPIAMEAQLDPGTCVTWQTPLCAKAKLVIARQQHNQPSIIKSKKTHPVHAQSGPVVPTFAPWNKMQELWVTTPAYAGARSLNTSVILLRKNSSGSYQTLVIDRLLGLKAQQLYMGQLLHKKDKQRGEQHLSLLKPRPYKR